MTGYYLSGVLFVRDSDFKVWTAIHTVVYRSFKMTYWWEEFRDSVRYSGTRAISSMLFADSSCGTQITFKLHVLQVKYMFMNCFSFFACSNGYTVIGCNKWNKIYNTVLLKGNKKLIFYFIWLKTQHYNSINCMEKVYVYQQHFNQY